MYINKLLLCELRAWYYYIIMCDLIYSTKLYLEYFMVNLVKLRTFSKKEQYNVVRPQVNGQVEALNKIIKHNLKTKLEDLKEKWVNKLPEVLWAYRTTIRTPTRETLFSLSYGYKAMVPVEIRMSSLRRKNYNQDENHLLQRSELSFLEEK